MKIYPTEIENNKRLVKGNHSFRVINKVKESSKTITFLVKHYKDDRRCLGDFTEKEITYRKSTLVESREEFIGTKLDQLHRINSERLNDVISRGLDLYRVKKKHIYRGFDDGIEVGDYMFARFNGVNYETETILDAGTVNGIPPSRNSDKPQISGWNNTNGGFEDYYEKLDMDFIKGLMVEKK